MLKTDYKGFGEFMEKIKTAGEYNQQEHERSAAKAWHESVKNNKGIM